MPAAIGSYAFVHARLGASKAQFLSPHDWEELLQCRTYEEQRRVLSETGYADVVGTRLDETIEGIRGSFQATAAKIERSVPSQAAVFLRAWRRRDLLRNLRTILRGKAMGRPEDEIRADLVELVRERDFPAEALLRCSSVEAALDLLENTRLRHWIHAARRLYERDRTLFGLDSALDRLFYAEVREQLERLSTADQSSVRELILLEIDQVNLLWTMRYRLNYQLSPAETYYLLVPVTGHIHRENLKQLVQQDSLAGIVREISYAPLRRVLEKCEAIWQAEVQLWQLRVRVARKMLRRSMFALGEVVALLLLKIVEVRDLLALLHAAELNIRRHHLEKQLIGYPSLKNRERGGSDDT